MNSFRLDTPKTKESSKDNLRLTTLLKTEITFGSIFNNRKKEDFYIELAVLLKAGIQLKDAIVLLEQNQKKQPVKDLFHNLSESLIAGQSLFEVLQENKAFTEYEYYSVKIGEETGSLPRIVTELGKFYAQKNIQRRNLINAMTYPLIILSTAVLVVVFMLRMVVPMFEDIFKQNGVELPAITRAIITCANFLKDYGGFIIVLSIVLFFLRKVLLKKLWFKVLADKMIQRIPFFGVFVTTVHLAQFTQAVSLLTSSKIAMLQSIQLVKKMIHFTPLNEALEHVEKQVLAGVSLHESMGQNKIFDNKMISLVRVAEETNQTAFIFERLSEQYAQEVQQKSKMISTLMEPFIIIIIGLLVGIILIAMYLPMFKLSTVIG